MLHLSLILGAQVSAHQISDNISYNSFGFFNVSYVLLIIGLLIILALSPIQDNNKPFTDKQYKRFKIISKVLATIFILVFTILELSGKHDLLINKYYFSFCYGIDLVALALLISKIERSINHAKN